LPIGDNKPCYCDCLIFLLLGEFIIKGQRRVIEDEAWIWLCGTTTIVLMEEGEQRDEWLREASARALLARSLIRHYLRTLHGFVPHLRLSQPTHHNVEPILASCVPQLQFPYRILPGYPLRRLVLNPNPIRTFEICPCFPRARASEPRIGDAFSAGRTPNNLCYPRCPSNHIIDCRSRSTKYNGRRQLI
jgi:hypothetical protein